MGGRGEKLAGVLFQTQPAYTLGLVRMAFGAVAIGWTVSLRPDLYELFGPRGVEPPGKVFNGGFRTLDQ